MDLQELQEIYKIFPRRDPIFCPKEFKYGTNVIESWSSWERHFNEYYRRKFNISFYYCPEIKMELNVIHTVKLPHLIELVGSRMRRELK